MATRKVIIWNIEEFGNFTPLKKGPPGELWYLLTLNAIADIVNSQGADVLVIQEFRRSGRRYLPYLSYLLGADQGANWNFDYIPGSLVNNVADPEADDLGYTVTGNNEGYAVLWNEGAIDQLDAADDKLSAGENGNPDGAGFISLVLQGRPVALAPANVPITVGAGNFVQAKFPQSSSPPIVGLNRQSRSGQVYTDDNVLLLTRVRRPCRVSVGGNPVVVYHAPNGDVSSFYGALACGAAEQLRNPDGGGAAVGGDFNITTAVQLAYGFSNFTGADMTAATAAEDHLPSTDGYQRTMVHYVKKGSQPPELVTAANTYGSPRDQVFYGNSLMNGDGGVVDVLTELTTANTAMAKALLGNLTISMTLDEAIGSQDARYQLPAVVTADQGLVNAIKAPFADNISDDHRAFANKLAAATFYRLFVSDHLPLWVEFEV